MVDFDDLKGKAESLLGEHGDQVDDGIDKLADLAGKKFGHANQIDQAAEKLKDLVDEQQKGGGPGSRGQRKPGGPLPAGKRPGQRPRPKPGPRPHSS
jgi:hypothetical protein